MNPLPQPINGNKVVGTVKLLPKFLYRKISPEKSLDFVSKIGPATGVTPVAGLIFETRITAWETCSRAVISLQKNLSRKISRFFVSKISPATGVT